MEQSTMYQRVRFILRSFAESCRRYSISRAAGYKWWTRFLAEGFEGLHDRSHRPHHCPHAVAEGVVEHVVDLRQRYGWGSRKIRKLTAEKFGEAPARRTIDRIFERHDLITKKRRRSGKPGHPGKPLTPMDEPNAVWTVDFKGQFKMLLLSPYHPRFQPAPEGCTPRRSSCIKVFREFLHPPTTARLPSASLGSHASALGGSGSIRAWSQQNGRHETHAPNPGHSAAEGQPPCPAASAAPSIPSGRMRRRSTPDSVYRSARSLPRCPSAYHPEHFEVRKVSERRHPLALALDSARPWATSSSGRTHRSRSVAYFGPTTLGWFDEELFVIFDTHGNTGRNPIVSWHHCVQVRCSLSRRFVAMDIWTTLVPFFVSRIGSAPTLPTRMIDGAAHAPPAGSPVRVSWPGVEQ